MSFTHPVPTGFALQCVSAFRLGLTTCVMFRRKRSRLSPTRSHYIWHERTAKSSCLTCAVLGDFAFACSPKCPNGATILRCHRGVFSGLLYRPAVTSFCSRNHADCPWDAVLEQINRDWCGSIQFSPAHVSRARTFAQHSSPTCVVGLRLTRSANRAMLTLQDFRLIAPMIM